MNDREESKNKAKEVMNIFANDTDVVNRSKFIPLRLNEVLSS